MVPASNDAGLLDIVRNILSPSHWGSFNIISKLLSIQLDKCKGI